jgi:hypothetical protein
MRRDTLELADGSLFTERIKRTFTAADADPVIRAHAFLSEKACADDSTARIAAVLLMEQDANATTVAAALLTPILWKECIDPSEIRDHFGSTVATALEEHASPFIPTDHRQLRRRDIHAISSSTGGRSLQSPFVYHIQVVSNGKSHRLYGHVRPQDGAECT